jgi:tetratricopeptide (TPR) repeat protein
VAYVWSGRGADALSLLEQVLEPMPRRTSAVILCSEASLLAGRVAEASQLAQRALTQSRNHKQQGNQAQALWLLGEVARHRDPPEIKQTETHYQQVLSLANELGMRPLQAHYHRGLGTLYRQTGQVEQARAELTTAGEMYREMEMTFWLPETEAVEGR